MILAAGLLLYSAVTIVLVDSSFPFDADATNYLALSRSIVSGEGYIDGYKPWPMPHTKVPPVLPCVLALAQWLSPDSMIAMKLAVAAFGLFSLIATYLLLRFLLTDLIASILTMALGVQLSILTRSLWIMSDIPYTFFSTTVLLLVIKRFQEKEASAWFDAAIGLTMTLAIMTRTIGIALLPGFIIAALLNPGLHKRRRCIIVISLIVIAGVVGWEVRNTVAVNKFVPFYPTLLVHKDPTDARAGLVGPWDVLKRGVLNANVYYRHLIRGVLPNMARTPYILPIFALLAAFGWLVSLIRRRTLLEFYLLFYGLILLAWPWSADRFLLPISALLLFYFVHGFRLVVQGVWVSSRGALALLAARTNRAAAWRLANAPLHAASIILAAFIALISLYVPAAMLSSDRDRNRMDRSPAGFSEFVIAVEWIREHAPHSAVIWTERPAACYIISGRKSFSSRSFQAAGMYRDAISQNRLFVIQSTQHGYRTASKPIASALEETRGRWHVVFRTGSTYVIAQNGAEVAPDQL